MARPIVAELTGVASAIEPLRVLALLPPRRSLTAIANDYGYGDVFAREVQAHGRHEDVLLAISISGSSTNILNAIDASRVGASMRPSVWICCYIDSIARVPQYFALIDSIAEEHSLSIPCPLCRTCGASVGSP